MGYENLDKELSIESIDEDELLITLTDVSLWNIKSGDISKIVTWYETQRVVISKNGSDVYPYLLTNLDAAAPDKVEASIA